MNRPIHHFPSANAFLSEDTVLSTALWRAVLGAGRGEENKAKEYTTAIATLVTRRIESRGRSWTADRRWSPESRMRELRRRVGVLAIVGMDNWRWAQQSPFLAHSRDHRALHFFHSLLNVNVSSHIISSLPLRVVATNGCGLLSPLRPMRVLSLQSASNYDSDHIAFAGYCDAASRIEDRTGR